MDKSRVKPSVAKAMSIDDRFSHVANNPIFRRVPKKEKRVDIDRRFHSMFHDAKFKLNYKTDKRGRPMNTSTDENLSRYYNLTENETSDLEKGASSKSSPKGSIKKTNKLKEMELLTQPEVDEATDDEKIDGNIDEAEITSKVKTRLPDAMKKRLHDVNVDYARGEGLFVSEESSEDDSSASDDEDDTNLMHEWGEIDKDAERTEEPTRRLALCNMDWDRITAADLMVLFNSFLSPGGVLKSVTIYPSEYGKQRLAEEEINGPKELVETKIEILSDEEEQYDSQDDEGNHYHMEKLRRYQLNRLKYYYAVLEFDTKETADKVYCECDGMEYESSATRIDLRFIPDDMNFDDESTQRCDALPEAGKYRPRFFTTTALQQIKVDLTWDETDPLRGELTEKMFDPKENIDEEDIRAYLASSDSEDDPDTVVVKDEDNISTADPIAKYRSLLGSIEDSEKKKKDKDVEMEITWGVGLKQKTEKLVKKKLDEKAAEKMTPWETMLAKQKESKKNKRKEKKGNEKHEIEDSEEDRPFSDDEVDVDLSDKFFQDEIRSNDILKQGKPKERFKVNEKKSKQDNASLELLLMDDDDNKNHFSLKKIIAKETEGTGKKKKRKNKRGTDDKPSIDDFQISVADDRFSALFSSHHFNIDPSDPNFKKTKAMETIITEKQKRRLESASDTIASKKEKISATSLANQQQDEVKAKKSELSYLVKSIQRNTQNLKKQSKDTKY